MTNVIQFPSNSNAYDDMDVEYELRISWSSDGCYCLVYSEGADTQDIVDLLQTAIEDIQKVGRDEQEY